MTNSKWRDGMPQDNGIYLVKYSRSKSTQVNSGVVFMHRKGKNLFPTLFGPKGYVNASLEKAKGKYNYPTIHKHKKVA